MPNINDLLKLHEKSIVTAALRQYVLDELYEHGDAFRGRITLDEELSLEKWSCYFSDRVTVH
jgi:hypothetical protein